MKCQKCGKPATFHISELLGPKPVECHLCEEHARQYLEQSPGGAGGVGNSAKSLSQELAEKLPINKVTEELQELDQQTCPVCGISFYDFRNTGRLGCPYDYDIFSKQIGTFLLNMHGSQEHTGKKPERRSESKQQMLLIKYRRDLDDAVQYEDYERAAVIRDKIKAIENASGQCSSSPHE